MPKSRKPRRKASRKASRKGKKCPPGCVKKTMKKSRKSLKRSRRRVSRKVSRKRRSVKRKVSRKRRSVKRKVSRKRKSAKRKSRKRKSAKRKVSRKRRSVKRKVSRKRKSAKRKSRKRKSAKRKSRKRKSAKRKSRKRKTSRKRKSAKRKSRKRKSAKRKSRKRNFGFFTQRMRDSMRRKYQRTKDSFGRTFSKNYISKHEFLPARKLPANLYPMFIQKFPRFRGRNPSSNPIIFKAKRGETASTFKRRIDRLFKNYRQTMYKKNYIEARQEGYSGSMKDHIEDYKAKQAHQKMVRLANLQAQEVKKQAKEAAQKESKSRKRCELIYKQIQRRRAKGMSSTALDEDFKTLCKSQKQLIMSNASAAKRKGAFIASARSFKNLNQEDVARIREELDKYKRACAKKGKNFSGRKNRLGQYMCDGNKGAPQSGQGRGGGGQMPGVREISNAAAAQWNSVPLKEKIRRCQYGKTKLTKAENAENAQLATALRNDMKLKKCNHWIEQGEKAPTNSGSSYF